MRIKIESEFLPMLHLHFYLIGREYKKVFDTLKIIILLTILTTPHSIHTINNIPRMGIEL
jgi:hypothetical protein